MINKYKFSFTSHRITNFHYLSYFPFSLSLSTNLTQSSHFQNKNTAELTAYTYHPCHNLNEKKREKHRCNKKKKESKSIPPFGNKNFTKYEMNIFHSELPLISSEQWMMR